MDTRESPRHDDHRRASARDARRRHAPGVGPATPRVIIDGIQVMVPPGTSVMRAAKLAGVDVAKLCATDSLEAFGSCRLCLAEVEGMQGTPASRTTPCADGTSRPAPSRCSSGAVASWSSTRPTTPSTVPGASEAAVG